MNEEILIKCPHCGCEYLPCEIFYPNEFLGKSYDIVKDENGKIITYSGKNMNKNEEFVCEHCGKEFEVCAQVFFDALSRENIFDEDFVEKLN